MVILLVGGALIFWLGAQAPNEDGEPPAYQSVLLVTGAAAALRRAADSRVLGADFDGSRRRARCCGRRRSSAALALWPAFERNSAISLLLAAILGGVALLSAWSWSSTRLAAPYRWLLALYAAVLVLVLRWRCASRRAATPRC